MRAAIALGSNLGDRLANLQRARDRIRALGGITGPKVQSAVYETSPVDCEPGAKIFTTRLLKLGSRNRPRRFLKRCKKLSRSSEENATMSVMSRARLISICCISAVNVAPMHYCNCRIRESRNGNSFCNHCVISRRICVCPDKQKMWASYSRSCRIRIKLRA